MNADIEPGNAWARIAEQALEACAAVFADTAEHGPAIALERLADKLNAWDAVEPDDNANYEKAMARLASGEVGNPK